MLAYKHLDQQLGGTMMPKNRQITRPQIEYITLDAMGERAITDGP